MGSDKVIVLASLIIIYLKSLIERWDLSNNNRREINSIFYFSKIKLMFKPNLMQRRKK